MVEGPGVTKVVDVGGGLAARDAGEELGASGVDGAGDFVGVLWGLGAGEGGDGGYTVEVEFGLGVLAGLEAGKAVHYFGMRVSKLGVRRRSLKAV